MGCARHFSAMKKLELIHVWRGTASSTNAMTFVIIHQSTASEFRAETLLLPVLSSLANKTIVSVTKNPERSFLGAGVGD